MQFSNSLCNDAINGSVCTECGDMTICRWWLGKYVERSGPCLFEDTISDFATGVGVGGQLLGQRKKPSHTLNRICSWCSAVKY